MCQSCCIVFVIFVFNYLLSEPMWGVGVGVAREGGVA